MFFPIGTEDVESPRVVTVMLPEHRGYFVQHLGYFLATFLLMAFIVLAVVVLTRRRIKRGIVPLTLTLWSEFERHFYYGGGGHSGAQSDVLFVFQKWSMSCVHMSGKKQL